ncbi:hypothetical protein PHLGIDRAFT_124987 [Phlebiopsis gigantea 11061_1 CR5-6]|uniref:Uncharacterized protein n=1 Tax=Phlebiopsis gigantea (strain 11061_1 CR5-6) TaxID=745531 RepID=A0A0C3SCZ3_PHLG1|nr:hypothetical protein PHLGIDRAFT_124987 [Phlebiopsis gigantea 11061_1 CR5-6]
MVVVAVKVTDHKKAVTPAIKAGKAVFVEWPLGRGLDETKELAALAKQYGVRAIVGAQATQSPVLRKIAEVIKSGGIGRVLGTSVSGMLPKELGYWGPSITERSTYVADGDSGASLLDVAGGHFFAGLTYLLGDFTSVSATFATLYPTAELIDATYKPTGVQIARVSEDQLAFSGTLASGALVSFHIRSGASIAAPGRAPLVWIIDGEAGTIRVEGDSVLWQVAHPRNVLINGEKWEAEQELVDVTGNLQLAWEEFAKGPEGDYFKLDDAVRVHTLVDAVRRSARDGVRVDIA